MSAVQEQALQWGVEMQGASACDASNKRTPDQPMSGSIIKQAHDLLCFQEQTRIVDVGANPIEGAPPYESLLVEGLCLVTGFEPNLEALAALDAKKSSHETYLPYAIGDGSRKKLNLCRHSGWTSTLVPSELSLDVFSAFKENAAIIAAIEIETKRLDDVVELGARRFFEDRYSGRRTRCVQQRPKNTGERRRDSH